MVQLQMIDRTKFIAQQDENVSAVFMYGSFTKNEGDPYSDIEFYVFLKSKNDFSAISWVGQIHPVALYFTNEYGSEVAIFENMVRGEFHFLKTDEVEIIKTWDGLVTFSDFDQMNLVDKEGILAATFEQIKTISPDRATDQSTSWLSQSLLNGLLTANNLIQRGEWAHTHQMMSNVQKYLLWLIRIATNKTQHWESPTKSLEKDIDPIWYSAYQKTTSDLQPENIILSFEQSIKTTKKLFDIMNIDRPLKEILDRIENLYQIEQP